MTSVNEKDIRDIAGYLFTLGGGPESGLRVHERALLGNPDTGEIEVALEDAGAPGWVWLHQQGVPYPTTDEEGVQEDIPGAVFTAVLPPHIRKSLNLKLGLPVRFRMVDGRNEVIGADGAPAAEYEYNSAGVSARDPVDRRQLDWLLIRPQDPPGRGVVLGGGVVRIGDTMYNLPVLELQDIITGNIGGLDTGQALAVLITQDTTDLTDSGVTLTAGSAFTDNRATNGISDHAALFGDYPDTANDEDIVYGWVKLYAGMDTVRAEDIYPALDTGGGSGGGAVDASNVTYTADDVGNWDGPPDDAAEALDELAGRVETLEAGSSSGGITSSVKVHYNGGETPEAIEDGQSWQVAFGGLAWDTDNYWDHMAPDQVTIPHDSIYQAHISTQIQLLDTSVGVGYILVQLECLSSCPDESGLANFQIIGKYAHILYAGVPNSFMLDIPVTCLPRQLDENRTLGVVIYNGSGDWIFVHEVKLELSDITAATQFSPL